jgi:hypothetical protein
MHTVRVVVAAVVTMAVALVEGPMKEAVAAVRIPQVQLLQMSKEFILVMDV